jgi:ribosomal protein S1
VAFAPSHIHFLSIDRPVTCIQSSTSPSIATSDVHVSIISTPKKNKVKSKATKKTHDTQTNDNNNNEIKVTTTTRQSKSSPQTSRRIPQRKEPTNNNNNNKSLLETETAATPLRPITDLVLGSTISGTVVGMSSFGVFVKIPYDLKVNDKPGYALLHKSQIQNEEIAQDLSELFQVGQVLPNLRVTTVNYAKGEVGVSLRSSRPKRKPMSDFQIGQQVTGKVASLTQYGAFIDIGAKVNPLLHISRISQEKITKIRDVLKEGDTVNIHIIDLDESKKSMSASMLSPEADEYLSWRSLRKKRTHTKNANGSATTTTTTNEGLDKSELEFFQDALKDLEKALGVSL